jgi:hypothetical protein
MGGTYTANGTYTYSSGSLTLIVTNSTFPANEGPSGSETITVSSLTATQMTWTFMDGSGDTMMFTRPSGMAGDINGTWTGTDSGGSITVTFNNGSWNVAVTNATSGTGGTGGTVGSTLNVNGTWEGTYTDNYTTDPYGHIGSGTLRFTFNQTNNYITGTGFSQEFGTGLSNNAAITAGQINGNNLGITLSESGSDYYSSWTTTTQVSGTVSGNTINGNYQATTIVSGSAPRSFMATGTFTLNKKY